MARRRRKYVISGDEYTFGGGASSGVSGTAGTLRIAKGNPYTNNANFDGFLNDGDIVSIKMDAGTSVATKDQYVYFDNAFETNTGQFEMTYADGATSLPSGLSYSTDNDSTNTDTGYFRFYGTPSTEGTSQFSVKYFDNAGTEATIHYHIKRFPAGTTPVWTTSTIPNRIIKDLADPQVLAAGPATTHTDPAPYYTLKDVSGFATGVVPVIDSATGEVTVSNTPSLDLAAVAHSFTVVANLGNEVGTFEQTFTGNVAYGGPYGARYWGPGNSYRNWSNGDYTTSSDPTQQDGTYWFAPAITTGAIKCTDRNRDTSPYGQNDGYGLNFSNSGSQGCSNVNSTSGSLYSYTNGWYIGSNNAGVAFKWTVPTGVTSFCVVGISGGCHGGQSWANDGGGSGALAYVNDVTCTPGEEFIVRIGMGRSVTGQSSYWAGDTYLQRASNSEFILYCYGAGYYSRQSNIGIGAWSQYSYDNNQRNPGAGAASSAYGTYAAYYGGWSTSYNHGAGTAGYRGTGQGGSNAGPSNTGGARNGRGYSSTYGGSAGGGTGLDGNGVGCQYNGYTYGSGCEQSDTNTQYGSGQAGWRYGGSGGSGGSRGTYGENPYTGQGYSSQAIQGGTHGGGGGGSGSSWGSGPGGPGGLRIIWGDGRAFPNTYTTENPVITNQS